MPSSRSLGCALSASPARTQLSHLGINGTAESVGENAGTLAGKPPRMPQESAGQHGLVSLRWDRSSATPTEDNGGRRKPGGLVKRENMERGGQRPYDAWRGCTRERRIVGSRGCLELISRALAPEEV